MKRIIIATFLLWSASAAAQSISPAGGSSLTTPVSGANGGTGVANTGSTITLGASVVTTGAGAPTLAFPATPQTYTFCATSCTTARTDAAQTLTGTQTINPAANTSAVVVSGGSITGSSTVLPGINITGTLNTSGTVDGAGIFVNLTKTAAGAGTTFVDIQSSGTSLFSLDQFGNIQMGAGGPSIIGGSSGLALTHIQSIGISGLSATDRALLTSPSTGILQHGAVDAASPVAQTVKCQSVVTGTSNTAGADCTYIGSLSTGTGVGGKLIYKVALTGTTGTTQNSAFPMFAINPGAATTATVQFGDGTNFTTYDSCTALTTSATGVIQCTASAIRFKDAIGMILSPNIDMLHPAVWSYKPEFQQRFGEGIHVGLYADDVAKMDQRCAVYENGEIKNYEDRCVIAYLVATVQNMKATIETLKRDR